MFSFEKIVVVVCVFFYVEIEVAASDEELHEYRYN